MFAFSVGCVSGDNPRINTIQPMPAEPTWIHFTEAPIIGRQELNFIVSSEFVKSSIQQKRYLNKLKRWKVLNRIP